MNADTNEFEGRATPSEGERLHQLLCATVLGEASEAQRLEVERALATSPQLRAERQRLEATIGLFQDALTDGERLSPAAERELAQALARRRSPPWYARPAFRLAASLVAMGSLGWVAWRSLATEQRVFERSSAPASGAPTGTELARRDAKEQPELRGLGYLPAHGAGPAPSSPAAPKRESTSADFGPQVAAQEPAPAGSAERGELGARAAGRVEENGDLYRFGEVDRLAVDGNALGRSVTPWLGDKLHYDLGVVRSEPQVDPSVFLAAAGEAPSTPSTSSGLSLGAGAPSGPSTIQPGGVPEALGKAFRGDGAPAEAKDGAARDQSGRRIEGLDELGYLDGPVFGVPVQPSEERAADDARRERGGQVRFDGNEFVVAADPKTVEARIRALLDGCRRLPNERPRDMYFRFWGDNGYEYPSIDRLSTFSVDVDTASYALARNYLVSGYLPEKHAVRTEEFLNYFKGDVRPPDEGTFAIETEIAPSLFGETRDSLMLRVAIRGKEISKAERTPVALTFVIDVSGSMREQNRLELVKDALRLLVTQLDARDSVAIVTFTNDARLVLPMTSARNRLAIEQALQPLSPQSGTNTEAGLRLGYEQAHAHLDPNAQNRVVLLTDGVANVGVTDPAAMTERVAAQRKAGIYLNTIGVGMNNHNDGLLEQLADRGDGLCNYVDDAAEAKRALVDNFTGAFQPIARDVKVQVEFDPAQVARYRLLGYENRAIADRDFRDDRVDAGEVGAGHQVVALYELVPAAGRGDGPLAVVRLRWKDPHGEGALEKAHESEHAVTARSVAGSHQQTSPGYRRAVLVAQFAEFLRHSVHANGDSLDRLIDEAQKLGRELRDPEFDELVALVVKSRELILARIASVDRCDARLDELRRIECLRAEAELLGRGEGELSELEGRRATLEREVFDCLQQRMTFSQR